MIGEPTFRVSIYGAAIGEVTDAALVVAAQEFAQRRPESPAVDFTFSTGMFRAECIVSGDKDSVMISVIEDVIQSFKVAEIITSTSRFWESMINQVHREDVYMVDGEMA